MECKSCGADSSDFEEDAGDYFEWSDADEWICPDCVQDFLESGQND